MNHDTPKTQWPVWSCLALAAILSVRLAMLGRLALTDNTESRYGGIAWRMLESGDWVTPRMYYDGELVAFSGKPPLEFWLAALSYKLFGVYEWAARLPNFLIGIGMIAATVAFTRQRWGTRTAVLAGIVLSSSISFFLLTGACVLDVPLAGSVTAAMLCFARFVEGPGLRRLWGLGFFAALGVGMLAKGPVALVLVGLALGVWIVLFKRWRLIAELPWLLGPLVSLAIAAPWYYLAEKADPGFLQYFFVNEHLLRYVSNEYGDRYGFGRKQPYGMSWLMLLGTLLPWTLLAVGATIRSLRAGKLMQVLRSDPWCTYAVMWGLAPVVFFTFARQMVYTYLLPGLPGLAIAIAVGLDRWMESDAAPRLLAWLRWHFAMPALVAAGGIAVAVFYQAPASSTAAVLGGLAVLGWLAGASVRRGPAAALAALALATTVTFGAAMYLLAPVIDERYSTRTILAEVYHDPAAKQRPVVIPFAEAYSADFYENVEFDGRLQHYRPDRANLIERIIAQDGDEIFLLMREEWQKLDSELADQLAVIAQTTHWVACERKNLH
jgi:4-amino-4-deoxy-L-arabinose transferase-like glycosyltransferase